MRNAVCILLFFCLTVAVQAVLVDDFENYELGSINTVTTTWVGAADPAVSASSTASIALDPIDIANQAIQLTEGGGLGQQWVRATLSPTATIAQGATGTLFVRFRATAAIDSSFGLTDLDTASNDWAHFRVQIAVINGTIRVRDNTAARTLAWATTGTQVALNTDWYYLWVVVDNNTDTSKIYLNQTGVDATEADRLVRADLLIVNTFPFRSAADALDRFFWRAQNGANTRILTLDDINLTAGEDLSVPASLKPYGPSVEQTPDVPNSDINVVLKWKAGKDPADVYAVNPDIVTQYVFLSKGTSTDPNLYYSGTAWINSLTDPNSEYGPVNCNPGQLYRWTIVEAIDGYAQALTPDVSKLDEIDPNNIIGPTWTFTSVLLVPSFKTKPANQFVFAGQPATFSVVMLDGTGVTYRWYKDSSPLSDISGKISGAQTATLTISDVQYADEGTYFCRAQNSSGSSDSSNAILQINRLRSWYPLETDTADAESDFDMTLTQEGTAGLPALTAGSVDPLVGTYSLLFDNGNHATDPNGQYAQIGAGAADYYDLTITAWVYWDGGANWQRIFDFGNDTTHYMFLTPSNGSECRFVLNNNAGEQIVSTTPLPTGQWVFVAVTLGGNTGRLYINGETKATNTGVTINPVDFNPTLNYIGRSQFTADPEFDGRIDDLKIYNYELDPSTIAGQYHDVTGIYPCVDAAFAGSDYNLDNTDTSYCRVDLADFAVFAANWMNQGLYEP
jgi:hypothetical protein